MIGPTGAEAFGRLSDEELVGLVERIDSGAFEALYERHHVLAFSLAFRIVRSRDQAEDVVQEAFLGLWRDAGRYEPGLGSVRTWLMTIVRYRALDAMRRLSMRERKQAEAATLIPQAPATDLTSGQACARDEGRTMRAAVSGLPDDQRRVIELAFYGGFTQSEIANMLGVPLGTVKGRARLGLLKLRARLGEVQTP